MMRFWSIVLCGACAFAGAFAATAFLQQTGSVSAEPGNAPPPPAATSGVIQQLSARFETVIRLTAPTVVAIEAVKPPKPDSTGKAAKPTEEAGSGVLVQWEWVRGTLVITNNHVVGGARPENITVHLADNRLFRPVQVWTDPESDVAVLRLDVESLPTAVLADSDRARVGQWVLAFGSPFGLNQTVTHGIISARERGQVSLGSTIRIKDFLQTDAAINPGSSGGPLVNLDGEVVGINTAIASQTGNNSGVAFSIPANMVKRVARQLIEKGAVSRGYLGVQLAAQLDPVDALKLGLERAQGALVESIYPDTPAAAAGLKPSDVILQVDDVAIRNENHFINLISSLPAGQKVQLRVWRNRKAQEVNAVVGDWAQAQSRLRREGN
jgi:S1-C subfamily serine protease